MNPTDPFDLTKLRLSQDFAATLGVKKASSRCRCEAQWPGVIRVHPG